jgi:hypothetical protein
MKSELKQLVRSMSVPLSAFGGLTALECIAVNGPESVEGTLQRMYDGVPTEIEKLRAENAKLRRALEKISGYHFDAKERDERYSCGAGCDMGESGRKTDERGHDDDCIFAVATRALAAVTPSTNASVPCVGCGKPMEDKGAAAQWCSRECRDKTPSPKTSGET